MANVLSFALGYLTKLDSPNSKNLLTYLNKLGISGIELTFATKERLYSFKLTKYLKRRFKKLKYISIHAPFDLIKKSKDEKEIIKQLDVIASLYSEVKAQNVIIHPDDLPSPEILRKYNFKVSTENLRKKRKFSISKLNKIFKKYPQLGFCLDTSHAYSWSENETNRLCRIFKDRITQVHLSARIKEKDHQLLINADKKFLSSIIPISKLDAPIVIEETFKKIDFKSVKKEIKFIKTFFKK